MVFPMNIVSLELVLRGKLDRHLHSSDPEFLWYSDAEHGDLGN